MILGIDVGTSSLEIVVYDKNGNIIGRDSNSYSLSTPFIGYSEQDPQLWISALEKTIKKLFSENPLLPTHIEAIGLSGQMHSLVLLDKEDKLIRPAILWNDVRCSEEVHIINSELEIEKITNNIVLEGFTLPKLLWVKRHEPRNWIKIDRFFLPSSYIAYKLTGVPLMDYSDASGTLLLDSQNNKWSETIFNWLELSVHTAPKLTWATENKQLMTKKMKERLGFGEQDVFVFSGSADNAASALAAGLHKDNQAMVSIGTSGVFLRNEKKGNKTNKKLHFFHHVLKGRYYSMGVTLAAGKSLEWYKNLFFQDDSYEEILSEIDSIEPGSNGLLFTPYIMGERTPHSDSRIRGSFIGLDVKHSKKHFVRSILEGICFSIKESQAIGDKETTKTEEITSVGGGSKSPIWLQMQADIFDVPISTLSSDHGAALGAAMIASIGMGYYTDIENLMTDFVEPNSIYMPNKDNVKKYREIFNIYKNVYSNTRNICYDLHDLNSKKDN